MPAENRGYLSKNKKKTKDSQPSHKGTLNIGGAEYWLSAWINEDEETGERYFGLAVDPKEDKPPPAKKKKRRRPAEDDDDDGEITDDDIPFAWAILTIGAWMATLGLHENVLPMWV